MLFDTHCHLNFKAFNGRVDEIVISANNSGVTNIVIPGTDIELSKKAVEISEKYDGVYAAVGIHPHHIFQLLNKCEARNPKYETNLNFQNSNLKNLKIVSDFDIRISNLLKEFDILLSHPKVVAVGEVGLDYHQYQKTVYDSYQITSQFITFQKKLFIEQIKLAHQYNKSLILHNREAKKEMLEILTNYRAQITDYQSVFHCCEPDSELLEFAKKHQIFIGVDGDITYRKDKQEFIKTVPLEMLVLETDAPFLTPEPLRSVKGGMKNEPKNIKIIAEFIAKLLNCQIDKITKQTTENARRLFKINIK